MESNIPPEAGVCCGWQGTVETAPESDCTRRKLEEPEGAGLLR